MKFVIIFANLIKNVPEVMLATNPSVIKTALYLMIVEMTRFVKSNLLHTHLTIIFGNFVVKTKNRIYYLLDLTDYVSKNAKNQVIVQ